MLAIGNGGMHVAVPTNMTGKRIVGLGKCNNRNIGKKPTNSLCVAFIVPRSSIFGHLNSSLCVSIPLGLCATMLKNRRRIGALGDGIGLGIGPRARGNAGMQLGKGNFPICGGRKRFNSLVIACGIGIPAGLASERGRLFERLRDVGWGGRRCTSQVGCDR